MPDFTQEDPRLLASVQNPGSSRQGFRWWEIDLAYYMLVFLGFFGIVWDLRQPPEHLTK